MTGEKGPPQIVTTPSATVVDIQKVRLPGRRALRTHNGRPPGLAPDFASQCLPAACYRALPPWRIMECGCADARIACALSYARLLLILMPTGGAPHHPGHNSVPPEAAKLMLGARWRIGTEQGIRGHREYGSPF
jgi:hypothetical protein